MKAYFKYLLKLSLLETVIISIVTLIIQVFSIYMGRPMYTNFMINSNEWAYGVPIVMSVIMLLTTSAFVCIIILLKAHKLKSKHYTDVIYALPISRRKLVLTHLLVGLIQVIIILTVSFIGTVSVFYALSNQAFKMDFVWLMYPVLLFLTVILYSIFQLFIYRANNIVDAVCLIFGYAFLGLIIIIIIQRIKFDVGITFNTIDEGIIIPYYGANKILSLLLKNATPNNLGQFNTYLFTTRETIEIVVNSIVYMILGALAFIYTIFKVKTDKIENVGGVTTSNFGYKVLNPLIVFFSSMLLYFIGALKFGNIIFFMPILMILYYIMYIIYYRKFRIPRVDYIVVGFTLFASFIVTYLITLLY